jgi:YfiH family protein
MKPSEIIINQTEDTRWLSFPPLQAYDFLLHGFLLKHRNCSPPGKPEATEQVLSKITSRRRKLVTLSQMHGDRCVIVSRKQRLQRRYQADAVFTDRDDVFISVQVADCLPIFLVNQTSKVVGLVHAGWRGTLMGIAQATLRKARTELGCRAEDFTVLLGPCIQNCCYQVSHDVAILFDKECIQKSPEGRVALDLICANAKQLTEYGVKHNRIWVARECTCCRADLFFSHRREPGANGRMIGFMGLK